MPHCDWCQNWTGCCSDSARTRQMMSLGWHNVLLRSSMLVTNGSKSSTMRIGRSRTTMPLYWKAAKTTEMTMRTFWAVFSKLSSAFFCQHSMPINGGGTHIRVGQMKCQKLECQWREHAAANPPRQWKLNGKRWYDWGGRWDGWMAPKMAKIMRKKGGKKWAKQCRRLPMIRDGISSSRMNRNIRNGTINAKRRRGGKRGKCQQWMPEQHPHQTLPCWNEWNRRRRWATPQKSMPSNVSIANMPSTRPKLHVTMGIEEGSSSEKFFNKQNARK